MTKIVAVVGGKHSGKTTVIENLVPQLVSRGYRVGIVKEMVRIPTLDTPATETARYTQAGAKIIVAVPRSETVVFIKKRLKINEILPFLQDLDYAILEGFEAEQTIPKIIAAKNHQEIADFSDGLAIAISGLIMDSKDEMEKASKLGIPMFSSMNQAEKIADIVENKAFDKLPELPHCSECGYASCYELAKAIVKGNAKTKCPLFSKTDLTIEVNGNKIPLKEFPTKIIWNMLSSMVSSLDGVENVKQIKIEAKKPNQETTEKKAQ